jgi:hypothetical protein
VGAVPRPASAPRRAARTKRGFDGHTREPPSVGVEVRNNGVKDLVAGLLAVLAIAAGVVQIFYLPFLFAAFATLALATAIVISSRYHRVYGLAVALISIGFVVGAAIAVATDHSLY